MPTSPRRPLSLTATGPSGPISCVVETTQGRNRAQANAGPLARRRWHPRGPWRWPARTSPPRVPNQGKTRHGARPARRLALPDRPLLLGAKLFGSRAWRELACATPTTAQVSPAVLAGGALSSPWSAARDLHRLVLPIEPSASLPLNSAQLLRGPGLGVHGPT